MKFWRASWRQKYNNLSLTALNIVEFVDLGHNLQGGSWYPRTDKGRTTVTPGASIGTSIIACNNLEKEVFVFIQISEALVSG